MKNLFLTALLCCGVAAADINIETVVDGLNEPWSVEELPNGDLLVSERAGQLRLIRDGKLSAEPVAGVPEVLVTSQGGFLDIELDHDYETNGRIYLSLTSGMPEEHALILVKAEFDGVRILNSEVILMVMPKAGYPYHYGGRILSLPDGTVLLTTGDRYDLREDALKPDSMLGKVLRVNPDGTAPDDNPFVGVEGAYEEIWTMGHRNPQALIRDPATGEIYLNEHGPFGGDEINLLEAGNNYGWPGTTYGRDYNGASVTPYTQYPGIEDPLVYWVPSIAPSGMEVYRGEQFSDWNGDLLVTALAERTLRRVRIVDGQEVEQEILLADREERLRDVKVAADGSIYVLTDGENASLLRLTPAATGTADLILLDADVYTFAWPEPGTDGTPHERAPYTEADGWQADASAIAISDKRILRVGSDEEILGLASADTEILKLDGATVLPGFVDSHAHVIDLGIEAAQIDVSSAATAADAVAIIKSEAGNPDPGEWIVAWGYDEGVWSTTGMPTWGVLNDQFADNPVVVYGRWGFSAWANRLAFDAAGISEASEDPVGGSLSRNDDGSLDGILLNNAVEFMWDAAPQYSAERWLEFARYGAAQLAAAGYVGVHEAGVSADADTAWTTLAGADQLPIRIYGMVSLTDEIATARWLERGPWESDNHTYFARAVKAYYDGTLGVRSAKLLADYSDQPGHRGVSGTDYGFDYDLAEEFMTDGFQIGIHAIGDAGNRESLNFIEQVIEKTPAAQANRHRLEHAQIVDPGDFHRLAELDVIASLQPSHAVEDMEFAEDRLGEARLAGAYPWRSLREHGAKLTFGSDLGGIDFTLFYGLHSSVTRQNKDSQPEGGWLPEQKLSIEEAIRAFTAWPAYTAQLESKTGSIEPGKWADLVAINMDPFDVLASENPAEFLEGEVVLTVMNGQVTHRNIP